MRPFLIAIALLLTILLAGSCHKAAEAPPGAPTKIIALDDAANPYRGKYSRWDHAAYEVLRQASDRNDLWSADVEARGKLKYSEQHATLTWHIDKNGYLIPNLYAHQRRQELYQNLREPVDEFPDSFQIVVGIPMSRAEYEAYRFDLNKVLAKFYPPIPKWLYERTPAAVQLLPDGNIACVGEPGVWQEHLRNLPPNTRWPNRPISNSQAFKRYLYDKDGTLLSSSYEIWTTGLYKNVGYQEIVKAAGVPATELVSKVTADGYFYFENSKGEILRIYDYTGELILGDKLPPPRDRHNFRRLPSHQVRSLYEAQQALKAETRAAP